MTVKEKVLVLTRAIPEESKKYGYTVCVAGLTENDEWRRLYPFEFRYANKSLNFRKKDMIEVEVIYNKSDNRKESRKVKTHRNLFSPLEANEIAKRLDKLVCFITDMGKRNESICVIKPDIENIEIIINDIKIYDNQKYFSFISRELLETREKVKMPIEVRYIFRCGGECCKKKPHKIIVIDWEINELTRNIIRREPNKKIVEDKMRKKLFDWMKTRNVYFIIGTHFKFKTPMIIGLFYPSR